jgi:hypothetical protein
VCVWCRVIAVSPHRRQHVGEVYRGLGRGRELTGAGGAGALHMNRKPSPAGSVDAVEKSEQMSLALQNLHLLTSKYS